MYNLSARESVYIFHHMFAYVCKDALYENATVVCCKVGLIVSCAKYLMMCAGIYGCVMTTILWLMLMSYQGMI